MKAGSFFPSLKYSSLGYSPIKMEEDVFGEERTNSIVKAYVESLENI